MSSCCPQVYNKTFDRKTAFKEQSNYLKKGPKKNSRPLINRLKSLHPNNLSLLDIGGGIGTIIFELFRAGIKNAQYIDISDSYVQVFKEEVLRRSLSENIEIKTGDFMDHHSSIRPAEIVTLDKVICCYKHFKDLVTKSVEKSEKYYAYVIPAEIWWVRLFHYLNEKIKKIAGNPFETFIHPIDEIERIVKNSSFQKIHESRRGIWLTVVFKKIREQGSEVRD